VGGYAAYAGGGAGYCHRYQGGLPAIAEGN
jgi:hypothetical protein